MHKNTAARLGTTDPPAPIISQVSYCSILVRNPERGVNPLIALKIRIQGRGRDVLHAELRAESRIEFEAPPVIGEVQNAVRPHHLHRGMDQLHVVPLHIKRVRHPAGIGERRGIQQHQVVILPAGLKPRPAVATLDAMPALRKTVVGEILAQPAQVGVGHVDAGGAARATERRVDCGRAGIAEQVEKILARCLPRETQPQRSVIEKQPGVEVVVQIDQQPGLPFCHAQQFAAIPLAPILVASALATTLLVGDVARGDVQLEVIGGNPDGFALLAAVELGVYGPEK